MGICACVEQIVRKFVWGSFEDGIKPALVKWAICFQPILTGGLGLRKWELQNKAFFNEDGILTGD